MHKQSISCLTQVRTRVPGAPHVHTSIHPSTSIGPGSSGQNTKVTRRSEPCRQSCRVDPGYCYYLLRPVILMPFASLEPI